MNITIVSHFRNAYHYIDRYMEQMDSLQSLLYASGHPLTLVLGYGDSTDCTGERLHEECSHRFDGRLVEVSHGGLSYGSIVHQERFKQLAFVGNRLWSHIPEDASIVGLVESDLIWSAHDLFNLICMTRQAVLNQKSMILAPMIMHLDKRFYDIWAFRMDGMNFQNEKPYHAGLSERRYYDMDSVGSVLFGDGNLMRSLSFPEGDVVVGFCKEAKERGAKIVLDSHTEVYHP